MSLNKRHTSNAKSMEKFPNGFETSLVTLTDNLHTFNSLMYWMVTQLFVKQLLRLRHATVFVLYTKISI